jgi:CDP-glucose 4,6-dehydratase
LEELVRGFWRDRPVLVTGATGLLGGWVTARLLAEGARPVCLLRDGLPAARSHFGSLMERCVLVHGDVRDIDLLARILGEYEVEIVLHLAAQTVVGVAAGNPAETFSVNVGGTWAVLEACRRIGGQRAVVVASSDKAYGDQPSLPYTESMPLLGRHPYDASKVAAEAVARSYAASFAVPVLLTRCANLYGGGDLNWNRLVPGTIRSFLRGDRPVIRSDGTLTRDYLYAEDAADAYVRMAAWLAADATRSGGVFNVSAEETRTVLEIVTALAEAIGTDLKPDVRGAVRLEIRHQHLSAERLRSSLGWTARYSLASGLERTVHWYREYLA